MTDHSKAHDAHSSHRQVFWRDWCFWVALLLGPLCWFTMKILGLKAQSSGITWQVVLWTGLIYPVLEEFVFRGGIQLELYKHSVFRNTIGSVSVANIITSLVFAAFHLINQPPLWAAAVFFPSLAFGWARDRYHHVRASIVLHCFYNVGFILLFST